MKQNYLSIFLLFLLILNSDIVAQTRKEQFGEVKIESTEEKKVNAIELQQNMALEYSRAVAQRLNSQASGSGQITLSDGAAFYFTGLYLYCASKAGACPFIVDTVLLGEYFNNKGQKSISCPNMKKVWELWVKNDYEKRLAYLVSVGSSVAMKNFNQRDRARYIKCEQTLAGFTPDPEISKSANLTVKLIEQIIEKKIDVFQATGAIKAPKSED